MILTCTYQIVLATDFRCVQIRSNDYGYYGTRFLEKCTWTGLNSTEYTEFNFNTNPTTTTINAIGCHLISVPYGLFNKFTSLANLNLQSSGISSVETNDFRGAINLITVNMSLNSIQKLNKHTFSHAPSLQIIDLSWNNITEISTETFENNDALYYVILNDNKIKIFDCILGNRIKALELQQNQLHLFQPNSTSEGSRIILRNNSLTSFDSALKILNHANVLDVSHNKLIWNETITGVTVIGMANTSATHCYVDQFVQKLDASNNQIVNVIILHSSKLREFYLAHNKLTSISNLTSLTNLSILDVSFNSINDINLETFSNMTELETLNLESSGIITLDYGIFAHQAHLKNLDISYNHLKHIDLKVLSFQLQLTTIFVDGNDLTSLDINDLHQMLPNLTLIGISDNRFNCSHLTSLISQLTTNGIKLHIDDGVKVKNRSNVMGLSCSNKDMVNWTVPRTHLMNGTQNMDAIQASIRASINQIEESNLSMTVMKDRIQVLEMQVEHLSHFFGNEQNNTFRNITLMELLSIMNNTNVDRFSEISKRVLTLSERLNKTSEEMDNIMVEVNDLKTKLNKVGTSNTAHPYQEALSRPENSSSKNESVESNLVFVKTLLICCFTLLLCIVAFMLVMMIHRYRGYLRHKYLRSSSASNAVIFDRDASSMM